jgi:hypothetical protein
MTEVSGSHEVWVGTGGWEGGDVWRRLAERIPTLRIIDEPRDQFLKLAALDIEIMATSMVVMKFDKNPPHPDAGCYRFETGSGWTPIVVVPPAYPAENWPADLPPLKDATADGLRSFFKKYGYEVALHSWTKVLSVVSRLRHDEDLRVGFHCKSIGYFNIGTEVVARAFERAYSNYGG